MPKQGKTPKKKSKEKTPQKSGESEYPAMDQEELNRLVQNAIEQSQAQLQQKHEEQIKRLEADREAKIKVVEERLTRKFDDEVRELSRAFDESRYTSSVQSLRCRPRAKPLATNRDRDVPGAKLKVSPIRQYFPDSARFTKIYPHHKIIL